MVNRHWSLSSILTVPWIPFLEVTGDPKKLSINKCLIISSDSGIFWESESAAVVRAGVRRPGWHRKLLFFKTADTHASLYFLKVGVPRQAICNINFCTREPLAVGSHLCTYTQYAAVPWTRYFLVQLWLSFPFSSLKVGQLQPPFWSRKAKEHFVRNGKFGIVTINYY